MAVYTEIDDDQVTAFVGAYAIGRVLACKGIAEGIENTNYLLTTDRGAYILTLYEKRVTAGDLPFFLSLMEHLAARGVPCPLPVRGRDGETMRWLAERPAAIVSFLEGMWPRKPTPEHCAALGDTLAAMHVAGADFSATRKNDLSVAAWRPLFEASTQAPDGVAPELRDELATELTALAAEWPGDLPVGTIHADLFPDNVFFQGGRLSGVIDFYFACTDFLAYDLAVCLNAWCFEPDLSFNVTKARRMLAAYRERRPVAPAEIEALPVLARGAAMRFLLTRLYDWLHTPRNALVTPKNPAEYLQRLRFHRAVRSAAAYGLE